MALQRSAIMILFAGALASSGWTSGLALGEDRGPADAVTPATTARPARTRGAVPRPPSPPTGKSLVWVGAHPDDEILVAGLIGPACVQGNSICTLVIATRGEKGDCLLGGGCAPDLGSVREGEFRNAAAILNAEPRVGDLPDGSGGTPEEVLQRWSAVVSGRQFLIATLVDIFRTRAADLVVTFDPRHGSTCHPDHRAVGELTLEAVQAMGSEAPALWFLEDVVDFTPGFSSARLSSAANDPATLTTIDLRGAEGSGNPWDFVLEVARAHPSQNLATAFASIAEADRKLYLLALWRFDPSDPRYDKCVSE